MITSKIIGTKIADARKKLNLSQAQLGERLFISAQAVGKWERGESMPDITMLIRLADLLAVDLNYFSDHFTPMNVESLETNLNQATQAVEKLGEKKPSWNLSNENLVDNDFSGMKNLHDKFSSSNIQRCLFQNSNLSTLQLKGNNMESCDFSGSDISGSQIQGSHLANCLFSNCNFHQTEITRSYIEGSDFTDVDFSETVFQSGGFGKNTIKSVTWKATIFKSMYLADLEFEGIMEDCVFENCSFTGVTFQGAILRSTFFKNNRKLKNIRFIDCKADKITYAFLKNGKADVSGIELID